MEQEKVIFKIQLPIETSLLEPIALIHNEDNSCKGMIPVTQDIKDVMEDSKKKFFYAHILPDGMVELLGPAPDQEW